MSTSGRRHARLTNRALPHPFRLRVLASPRDEAGLTLVEMLVAMTLTAVILGAAYTAVIISVQSLHRSEISTQNVDTARVGIEAITRDLRGADTPRDGTEAFEVAEADHVRFTTRAGITSELAHIDLRVEADGTLILTRTPLAASTSPEGGLELLEDAATTRVVARDLADPHVFRFFAADVDAPDGSQSLDDLEDAAQRHRIDLIEVSLSIASDGGARTRPTDLVTTVRMPNLLAGR